MSREQRQSPTGVIPDFEIWKPRPDTVQVTPLVRQA
jgi:hypothetical protein